MYRALMRFADLQDGNRIYEAGDQYPRPGFDVSAQRIAELAGSDNRMGYALIKAVEAPVKATMEEAKEIPAETIKPAKKAVRTRNKG